MRPPASAFENRTHGAEKIGLSRYSDFFNKIGPSRPIAALQLFVRYWVVVSTGRRNTCINLSAGVSIPKALRGRSLS